MKVLIDLENLRNTLYEKDAITMEGVKIINSYLSAVSKEQEKCTAALTNEELFKNLKYCGCDPYYMGWWEETCKEIADRLFVKWEEI